MINNFSNNYIKKISHVFWLSIALMSVVDTVKADTYFILQDCDKFNTLNLYNECMYSLQKQDDNFNIIKPKLNVDDVKFGLTVNTKNTDDKKDTVFWFWIKIPFWFSNEEKQKDKNEDESIIERVINKFNFQEKTNKIIAKKIIKKKITKLVKPKKLLTRKTRKKHMVSIVGDMSEYVRDPKLNNNWNVSLK